ncbi:MAG: mechanosensitive ion channel family protein [Clostridiales bacterium]|nr:mechanosensitive ion channel family protein [Clostridiales bacterium]
MFSWNEILSLEQLAIVSYVLKPVLIILAMMILRRLLNVLINRLKWPGNGKESGSLQEKRRDTIKGLLKNLFKYVLVFITAVMVLECFRIPVMAILSTAGIVGVALAFGAQSLCKDIITGFFILLEDQYYVGEYIEAQGVAGFVEQFNLRCTYLRDFDGRLHIMPNGNMGLVTNHNRGNRRVMVEIGIPYEGDIGKALLILQKSCDAINEEFRDDIREAINAIGVVDLTASGISLRMLGQSETMTQWKIERALRQKALEDLMAAGYEIPYPQTKVSMI